MCIDAKTSIVSFVVGSIINISVMLLVRKPVVTQMCLFWQWVLMMQLAEFLIWSDEDCGVVNYTGTKMAMFFNLTQPIVLFFVFFFMNSKPMSVQIVSTVVMVGYLGYMFQYLNTQKEYRCIRKEEKCPSLNLAWWNGENTIHVYFVTMILIVLLMSDHSPIIVLTMVYSIFTLMVSATVYSCGGPSMWCWMVVPFPLLLGAYSALLD
jgi:hypothetical protein